MRPLKRTEETDAIFEEVHRINAEADEQPAGLRISLDSRASVKIGRYSRGRKSRFPEEALDHDFEPEATLTPFGILLPQQAESHLWFTPGIVTAYFMVDRIDEIWARIDPANHPHAGHQCR